MDVVMDVVAFIIYLDNDMMMGLVLVFFIVAVFIRGQNGTVRVHQILIAEKLKVLLLFFCVNLVDFQRHAIFQQEKKDWIRSIPCT